MTRRNQYYTCPTCNSNLDIDELCDECDQEEIKKRKAAWKRLVENESKSNKSDKSNIQVMSIINNKK